MSLTGCGAANPEELELLEDDELELLDELLDADELELLDELEASVVLSEQAVKAVMARLTTKA